MKCKNTIAMVLAGAMLLPSNAFAADLSQYKDFPNDWSAKSLEQAIDDGLLNGSNGMIDAKGLLTRAQMAAIVSRAFGAAKTASLDDYRDVLPSAWYYSDMGKAVKMGAFQGANGLLNPDAPITREEAFTVLARAFALEGGSSATLKDFVDGGTVSSWASESVAALVAGGYVNGANGMLNLKNNITRAEFAKVITGMAASYVGAESVSGKTVEGNVIVRESGASLSGMTINGDLIIADSADKASLDNVKVTGRIVIRGGADAVSIKDSKAGKGVLVSSPNGAAAISVSGGSVGTVTAKSDLSLSGSVSNVAVTDKATLTVEKNASVGTVTVSAAGSKVTGDGKVTNVQANANNVTVTSKGAKVTAGSGVSGVKAGDKAVESGKTETVGSTSTSSGGSSGGSHSSGGGSSTKVTTWADIYKGLGVDTTTGYDAVTSATNFTGHHVKDIPTIVNKNGASLDGVKLTGKTASVTPKLSSASYAYSSKYGTGEFDIVPDDTVSGYVWNDYKNNLYAVTISDGTTTVGALPWVDYYGENATSGYHYNKVQIALNNGTSKASNEADVQRYKAFYDETGKHLKAGTYTVTLYSEGYEPLKAEVKVKADADRTATVDEADFAAGETTVTLSKALPSDFDADYSFTVNGKASDFFTHENGKITWNANASEIPSGTYQLVIHDNSSKYADITAQIKLNVYAYASVPYDEYWKSEGVYLSGKDWAASSDVEDTNGEKDKGAFDAVSRATTKHGRHRGSFQQNVVIDTKDSKQYTPVYWIDADTAVVSTGEQITLNKTNIQDYKITGIKYVPVKVSASDFADFCTKYTVTKNGKELKGGYPEDNLKAYSDLVADVNADTNGLKTVTKGRNGAYTFGKRQTGTGSGIKNQTLQTADEDIVVTKKTYDSANKYGAHLRVDLTNPQKVKTDENGQPVKDEDGKPVMVDIKNAFGALGDNMQTVVWKYYGDGDTVLATYGTKFAADNWIHSRKGIQLGLTDSLRFQLPEGTDGTGKWTITIYALGYSDTTYTVTMTKDNVAEKVVLMTDEQRTQLTDLAAKAKTYLDNANTKYPSDVTRELLKEHADKAAQKAAASDTAKTEAAELITELTGYLDKMDAANTPSEPDQPTTETKIVTGKISPADDEDGNITAEYNFSFEVTLKDGTILSIGNDTTNAGGNSKYWTWATTEGHKGVPGLFNSLIGKSATEIDSVDAVSKATVSSNAIKKAVKNALSK